MESRRVSMVSWREVLVLTWLMTGGCALDWQTHSLVPPLPITAPLARDPSCQRDSLLLIQALENRTLWAEQMWDASAKMPVGQLTGTVMQFGDFDECLDVEYPIHSQYCLVTLTLEVPPGHDTLDREIELYPPTGSAWDKIHFGGSRAKQRLDKIKMALCVPASCGPEDIEQAVKTHLEERNSSVAEVLVEEGGCSRIVEPAKDFTVGDIAFCVVMVVVFLLVSSATLYDVLNNEYDEHRPPANYVQCLSAYRGLRSLFKKDKGIPELELSSLYGIHVFAFVFIVVAHRFASYASSYIINYEDVEYMLRHYWLSIWTGHLDLFCDIFFFLSAFLLGVILSMQLDKGYISPLKVYLHRLVRLLPCYATVVFFYATVFYKLGSGPMWNTVVKGESEQCRNYWWVNMIFLNNYLGGSKMCLLQSWYLACDFQLFLGGVLLLMLLSSRPSLGLVVSAVLIVVFSTITFFSTYFYQRPALMTFYKQTIENIREDDMYTRMYTRAHHRVPGYLVGLLAGYAVFHNRNSTLSKGSARLLMAGGYALALLSYWSGALYTDPARPYQPLEAGLYASLHRSTFALGLSLIIWVHVLGPKMLLSDIFTWRGFVPLSKLSYCMYLVHNIPQFTATAASRMPVKFDAYGLVSWTLSDLFFGLMLSLVLHLLVESPCRYLFKHLTTPTKHHSGAVSTSDDIKDMKDTKDEADWSYRITNP